MKPAFKQNSLEKTNGESGDGRVINNPHICPEQRLLRVERCSKEPRQEALVGELVQEEAEGIGWPWLLPNSREGARRPWWKPAEGPSPVQMVLELKDGRDFFLRSKDQEGCGPTWRGQGSPRMCGKS